MSIQYHRYFILWLILLVGATEVDAQAPQNPQIISSEFGENLNTGCPRLQVIDDMLYAPGPDGIKRHGKGETASWESFAMQGQNVIDFRISDDDIVAVIIPDEYSHYTGMNMRTVARLVKGKVSGSSFVDITPHDVEYTYNGDIMTSLSAIAQHPTDKDRVMVMGYGGVFQSKDFGETWEKLTYHNAVYNAHSFLGWHPLNPDILFMTSESMIFVGTVWRSTDSGKTWQWCEPDPNSESSCHCIAFDPNDADHLLLSGEYKIYESFDCGRTWTKVLDELYNDNPILGYAYNIIYDPDDTANSTIYSVGHANGCPARNVVRSTDKGKTWQQCMTYDYGNDYNFFYDSALFDGKIWIYDRKDIVYWKINENSGSDNIATDSRAVALSYKEGYLHVIGTDGDGMIEVYDLYGRKVFTESILDGRCHLSPLSNGIYLMSYVRNGAVITTQKITV